MKIGFLLTEFPNQTSISIWRVAKALANNGNDVHIISTQRPKASVTCHPDLIERSKYVFYSWPPNIKSFIFSLVKNPLRMFRCVNYAFSLKESGFFQKCRIVALIPSAASIYQFSISKKLDHIIVHSCSTAAHLINLCYEIGGPSFSLRLGGDLDVYGKDHSSKFRSAHFILPASLNNRDEIVSRNIKEKARLLPTWLGVDTGVFYPDKSRKSDTSSTAIVSVARLNFTKGHKYILSALAILKSEGYRFSYTIAGSGPFESGLKSLVTRYDLDDCVSFVGQIDEASATDLLQRSDISVLASVGLGEASPMTLIEAMSAGVAVISTDIGGTTQIVTDGFDGLIVKQKDVDGLTDKLRQLISDYDLRQRLGHNARQSAVRYFDSAKVATAIETAITSKYTDDLESNSPIIKKIKSNRSQEVGCS